jgi:hypothetical protein
MFILPIMENDKRLSDNVHFDSMKISDQDQNLKRMDPHRYRDYVKNRVFLLEKTNIQKSKKKKKKKN